ncbi:DUF501 domain-containing protein [Natronospora cellulosivora (SeqCode)]
MKGVFKINKNDINVIEFQLGRKADNFSQVVKYCPFNKPAVLMTLPYSKENGVFPTTYWLSCPYLNKELAKLEDDGIIKDLSEKIKDSNQLREELMKTHLRYAKERFRLLGKSDLEDIERKSSRIKDVLKESGVGGIMDKEGIKCLHTHLADYLANKQNPIGKLVWNMVNWPEECDFCMINEEKG